jgi:hypothetical protein
MNDHHTTLGAKFLLFINWLAAFLGLGTFAGFVNVTVGMLSAAWLIVQLVTFFRYDLPTKRARLATATALLTDIHNAEQRELE